MLKVKALPKGQTRLTGTIRTMAGETLAFTEVIGSDAARLAFSLYEGSADIPVLDFDSIFGKLGCTGPNQWRAYRHYCHHAARL